MLKNIHPLLNGDLLAILDDMGHGNEIVIADANFGAANLAQRLVDMPGADAQALLDAVLSVLPLDDFVDAPAAVMIAPDETRPVYDGFQASLDRAEGRAIGMEEIDPGVFCARTERAYAVIASGERRLYGNIILRKGVIRP
ncbi:RbsD/FucU family protein [Aureimonas frigidaquae]|uniref:Uncharacterized protein n=1 Tax=Aureimonas frigidaquae TaxID=424757 RepID=A0A0P0Z1R5_9HYPH|nr:RbsD/FucU domain-containing protein [Aureimonas frigidaquae]BAT28015.1 hypothetical protein [Aureimonas frigidaquae]